MILDEGGQVVHHVRQVLARLNQRLVLRETVRYLIERPQRTSQRDSVGVIVRGLGQPLAVRGKLFAVRRREQRPPRARNSSRFLPRR